MLVTANAAAELLVLMWLVQLHSLPVLDLLDGCDLYLLLLCHSSCGMKLAGLFVCMAVVATVFDGSRWEWWGEPTRVAVGEA
jgi:hypothetical protein